jgi:hydrogenase-4 component J
VDPQIAFYRLDRKVVHNEQDIPEDARQVMYYSLAIGHHVGVMDCFSELMAVPIHTYERFLGLLPAGDARCKLEGALRWNEIEINRSHVDDLVPALTSLLPGLSETDFLWVRTLIDCLQEMVREPAFYMMVKMRV